MWRFKPETGLETNQLFRVKHDRTGNQAPMIGIFPDQMAPVVRINWEGERFIEPMLGAFLDSTIRPPQ
jgi:hypothetical protein